MIRVKYERGFVTSGFAWQNKWDPGARSCCVLHSGKRRRYTCCAVYTVLQCVAVCCSVLQCIAVCLSVLQLVEVCRGVLLCVAACCCVLHSKKRRWYSCCVVVYCSVLQCDAVCCSVLQCSRKRRRYACVLQCVKVYCSVLHYDAVCCSQEKSAGLRAVL